ncbi:BT_3987 domain-containing protein [Bacteroides rodentium]
MKLNKLMMTITALAGSLFLLSGCSDDESCKVYIPEAKSLQIRNFDLGEELKEVFHVSVTGSDYATISGKEVSADVKVHLQVDGAKVQEYNAACGTSYSLLPEDCYTIETDAVIPAGAATSEDLVLTVNARGKIQPFDSYLLPVTITAVEGADADAMQQTLYYLLSGAEDVWNMPLADRSQWTVVEVSSEETSGEGSDNGHAIHAFDGKNGTFWHTQWKGGEPQPPHHIVVDMGQEVKMLGFQYVSRDHGEGWPQEMTMETSLDGESWESAGVYSDLPAGAKEEFRSYFPGFKQARYFRLTITAVYNGKWSTHVAEINAISLVK